MASDKSQSAPLSTAGSLVAPSSAPVAPEFPDGLSQSSVTVIRPAHPADSDYGADLFKRVSTGELFKLAVQEDESSGRSHFFKNKAHFVNVTAEEARAQFDRQ